LKVRLRSIPNEQSDDIAMGNLLQRTTPTPRSSHRSARVPPTSADYKVYRKDLAEVHDHFSKLNARLKDPEQLDVQSAAELEVAVRETDLEAVEEKRRQVANMRKFIRSGRQRTNPDTLGMDQMLERVGDTLAQAIDAVLEYRQNRLQRKKTRERKLKKKRTRELKKPSEYCIPLDNILL